MKTLLAAAAALALCAACAETPDQKAADSEYRAPVYRTGSNIPAGRDPSSSDSSSGSSGIQNTLPPKTGPTINTGRTGG